MNKRRPDVWKKMSQKTGGNKRSLRFWAFQRLNERDVHKFQMIYIFFYPLQLNWKKKNEHSLDECISPAYISRHSWNHLMLRKSVKDVISSIIVWKAQKMCWG